MPAIEQPFLDRNEIDQPDLRVTEIAADTLEDFLDHFCFAFEDLDELFFHEDQYAGDTGFLVEQRGLARDSGDLPVDGQCAGFEARGRNIGVLGSDSHGEREAEFLRRYSDRVTLLAQCEMTLAVTDRARLRDQDITVIDVPVRSLEIEGQRLVARLERGGPLYFDTLYPGLGSSPRTDLARQAGAKVGSDGSIVTDAHQQTDVPGLFAAGDVVEGLDQISVATGQAAIAATAIHNLLRDSDSGLASAMAGLWPAQGLPPT